uniref:NF-kappa-B inhibitor epsilon-like n=1 Tax=Pristiophorus japonicus TaxID=55135 RepID=UPI00398F5805
MALTLGSGGKGGEASAKAGEHGWRCDSGLGGEAQPQQQPWGPGPSLSLQCHSAEECCNSAYDSAYDSGLLDSFDSRCSLGPSDKAPAQEGHFDPWGYLSEEGDTFLHLCIIHEAEALALALIRQSKAEYLDWQNDLFQTPLHLAMYTRQAGIVRRLVLAGSDTALQDRNGNTALHLASLYRLEECARALTRPVTDKERAQLAWDAPTAPAAPRARSLERYNWQGMTCLHVAVLCRNVAMVELLLASGARVNTQEATSGRTALHLAVELGAVGLVARLVRAGGDVDAVMYNGCTPLHLAVGRLDAGIAATLCQAGADPQLPNLEQETALDLASSNWNVLDLCPFDDVRLRGQPVV